MKIAIMQPYFFPYIGYFQLIHSVDFFVLYDNIEYTKKGWINRNRILLNGKESTCTLPLKKQSDYLDVRDREIAVSFDRGKFLNQINGAYRKAPNFDSTFSLITEVIKEKEINLFRFLHFSIQRICDELDIKTEILNSSAIDVNHDLKGQDKVLAICKAVEANSYVNAIGGQELYSREDFSREGLSLNFIHTHNFSYSQFSNVFVPWLSIIDVMMFNSSKCIKSELLPKFELV